MSAGEAPAEPSGVATAVGEDDELMVLPSAWIAAIEQHSVVVCLPGDDGGVRLKRGTYDLYRAFHLPRRVTEVLPADPARRARVLQAVRLLAAKGLLVPAAVGIPPLVGDPEPEAEPDWISVLA